jgi:diguanylate cyclase (GGDEF)-like protein
MIQGTDTIQGIVKQAASLHVVNTVYFIGLMVLVLFGAHQAAAPFVTDSFLLGATTLLAAVFVLKLMMHYSTRVQAALGESQFELVVTASNAAITFLCINSLESNDTAHDALLLLHSFLPTLLFLLISPLTWAKQGQPFYGFFGFIEWVLILGVFSWSAQALYALYVAGAHIALLSNLVVLGSPILIKMMRQRHIEKLVRKMHDELYSDPLTQVSNRKCFYDTYDQIRRDNKAKQLSKDGLGVFFIDIDFFKQFNDRYGHDKGDDCLKDVAAFLDDLSSRLGLAVYRYGGEEFLLFGALGHDEWTAILNDDTVREWRASELRLDMVHDQSPFGQVTFSGGACFIPRSEIYTKNAAGMTKQADELLYQAKAQGRARLLVKEAE